MVTRSFFLGVLMFACVSLAFAQSRDISGTVIDATNGYPLPGVNIAIQGTTTGTATGIDGSYSIRANSEDVLVFSFVGYLTQEITVGSQNVINVALQEDVELLEEVVVVGYGVQKKADVTGAVGAVNVSEANVGLVTSPEQLIQGRVAGVSIIQNSGEPGSNVTVRIRGGTSISASNSPLYVIDGVPLDNSATDPGGNLAGQTDSGPRNPLNFLNPNDIANIDILKDASAAAIYGSRGANGVILITTKKGREGQVQVDYDGYVATSSFGNEMGLLTGDEYRNFVGQTFGQDVLQARLRDGVLGNANTDWQDAITQAAVSHSHSLAFGGGTAATQYRASVGYLDQEGIVISSGLERITGRINVNHRAFDEKLTLNVNLTGSYINDDRVPFEQTGGFEGGLLTNVFKYNPTLPIKRADGTFFEIPGQFSVRNPVAIAELTQDFVKTTRALGNLTAEYEFVEGLTGKVNVGLNRSQASRRTFQPKSLPVAATIGGQASQANRELSSKLIEITGTYSRIFGDAHNVSILGGYSWQNFLTEQFGTTARDFVSDVFGYNNLAGGNDFSIKPFSLRQESKLISFFGRINYDYNSTYIFSASLRRDGSSRFGADEKWGIFPAVTLGWRISSLLTSATFIDDLKLRVGWGVNGSQEIGNLRSLPTLAPDPNFRAVIGEQEVVGIAPNNFATPNLKWEETTQVNVGLDFSLWTGRVEGSVEYYFKDTQDLLLEFTVPQPAAVSTRLANAGQVENKGFEAAVNAVVIDQGDLTLDLGVTFNANTNEVKDLGGLQQIFSGRVSGAGLSGTNAQIITPGEPFGTFFGAVFLGFCGSDVAMTATECQGLDEGAQAFKLDAQGNRVREVIGDAQPDLSYGITTNLTWQNWDLSAFFRGVSGVEMLNNTGLEYTSKNLVNTNVNFLKEAADDPTPVAEAPVYSSRWVQDASFLRLENLTLGYTFTNVQALSSVVGTIRRARVYASAQNLFVLTDYDGFDPEVNTDAGAVGASGLPVASLGIDYMNYPRPRTFTLGLSLGF